MVNIFCVSLFQQNYGLRNMQLITVVFLSSTP